MSKFAQGRFDMKNPEKYVGTKTPLARSSWEFVFMRMLDEHQGVEKWASESIKIPYQNPLTRRVTVYVPDFFIQYLDKNNKLISEVIEIKPQNQQLLEKVGRNTARQAQFVVNQHKWAAATAWCKGHGLTFRVLNETDIFHQGKTR